MRTTAANQNAHQNSEDHHAVWELDGGGSHAHHNVVLFEGRLYSCPFTLGVARIKSRAKRVQRTIAGYVPLFFV